MTPDMKIHRGPHKERTDEAARDAILNRAIIAHVGITIDDQPYVLPVLCAPHNGELILHGSTASRLFKALAAGAPACVSITLVDGLVMARSTFNSSMHYQSLMAFGKGRELTNPDEKRPALQALSDHLMPHRREELRKSTEQELKATSVVAFPLDQITMKVADYDPRDDKDDLDTPVWAGVVPMKTIYEAPRAAADLKFDLPAPDYIKNWPLR
jgi:nitroimidazol reductase NimA-like FMN-containing flavoprotein (pyridoxamine 5'-phosphate oxidase superfamily)